MVKRVFTDRDLPAGLCNALTFCLQAFNLAQLCDDLLGRVPCCFHLLSLSASRREAVKTLYSNLDHFDGVMPIKRCECRFVIRQENVKWDGNALIESKRRRSCNYSSLDAEEAGRKIRLRLFIVKRAECADDVHACNNLTGGKGVIDLTFWQRNE